jgi:hypothetical protein
VGLLEALLILPRIAGGGLAGGGWIALEPLLLAGLFLLLPVRRWTSVLGWLAATAVTLAAAIGLADALMRRSLARPLNLYLDGSLADSLFDLLAGNLGRGTAILLLAVAVLLPVLCVVGLARLLRGLRDGATLPRARALGVALLVVSSAPLAGEGPVAPASLVATPAVDAVTAQVRAAWRSHDERRTFLRQLERRDPMSAGLEGLGGADVILAFIESYGVSAVDDPRYAPLIRPRLAQLEARVKAAGLHMATATLVSPVQGGQSWLAHGTVLSGLWLDTQLRYDLMLGHGPDTLIDDFERAGYRTVALMPAITRSWLAGRRLGYDRVFGAADIDYAGPPLNWVTMPDQFTWRYLEHAIRRPDGPPLFAELALISSHAPWTPILPVLEDWSRIGDGAVFQRWADAGPEPAVLWQDAERVRQHYALAVDYALAAATGYAERFVDDDTLLIVVGDHQPAPLITGRDASRAVPMHVISGDPALLRPFMEHGFRPGALPPPAAGEAWRMDEFRSWFLDAFQRPPQGKMANQPRGDAAPPQTDEPPLAGSRSSR